MKGRNDSESPIDLIADKLWGCVGPPELGAADDLEEVIVAFIDDATTSLDVAVQELDNLAIAEALIRRKRAGVSVRVVLNHSYLQDSSDAGSRPAPDLTTIAQLAADEGGHKINRDVFAALCRCNIEVRIDLNPVAIFHQKFCVRDVRVVAGERVRRGKNPGLLTGSANFTTTDCHTNLNHLLVFRDNAVEEDFAEEFDEAWGGEFGRGRLGKPPSTHGVDGVPVKILFAPDHGPEAEVVKQLLKSHSGSDIACAMFTFAGSSAIDDAMIVLAGAARKISVVLDRGQSSEKYTWSAAKWLKDGGVQVLVPKRRPGLRKLHHKLLVVDDATVVAGSFNYTEPATLFNDEALLVLGSPHDESEGVHVDHAACAKVASFFRAEIDRIAAGSEAWPGA